MSQTDEVRWYDLLVIMPFAYVISQSILQGNWFWLLFAYMFFIRYAHGRKEYV